MSILSVLFFIPFCRFRGNNCFEGERFPTEAGVGGVGGGLFFRAVSHQLYGNPNNHYLFLPH